MVKHDHFLFSPVIAQKIECTCKIAPNKETQFLESSLEDEILPYIATGRLSAAPSVGRIAGMKRSLVARLLSRSHDLEET